MEELLKQLLAGQKQIIERLDNLETTQKGVEQRLKNVDGQVRENSGFISALTHQVEELNAKYDGLLNITASKESIERIEANMATKKDLFAVADDVSYLVRKSAEQDSAIRNLRMVE